MKTGQLPFVLSSLSSCPQFYTKMLFIGVFYVLSLDVNGREVVEKFIFEARKYLDEKQKKPFFQELFTTTEPLFYQNLHLRICTSILDSLDIPLKPGFNLFQLKEKEKKTTSPRSISILFSFSFYLFFLAVRLRRRTTSFLSRREENRC